MARVIEIDEQVTVGVLADLLDLPVSRIITELLKNGVMATVNEKVDFDTAQIIISELDGLDVELAKKDRQEAPERPKREVSDKAEARPPVVAIMGHVDHGKTSLLDAIREADSVKNEAGGITQHLSAYQITHNDREITFLDTPGHEAFPALREHGARLTDVVVIVVAADEGIKPQTLEAIRFATKAGSKIIVAANKIDKTGADINRLKQQLAENELMPEDWGGQTTVMPVSAKTKEGIAELLDMILLVADVEELKADKDIPAQGLIIETHMEQGRGPVAIALVEQGTLKSGNFIVAGATYGKIRNLETTTGRAIKEALPSTPVKIVGLKNLPDFADQFEAVKDEKTARSRATEIANAKKSGGSSATTSSELLRIISRSQQLNQFNVLVKADVQGSLTSVVDSLKALDTDEVAVKIVGSGVGVINESDIHLAQTSNAIIYGFNVDLPTSIKRLAVHDQVEIRLFRVIYELLDDVKAELEKLLSPEVIETQLGKLTIKGIFKITKSEVICGGQVTSGKLSLPALARISRGKENLVEDLEVTNLKRGPTDVKEVVEGDMCGMSLKTTKRVVVQEDDKIEFYRRETKTRSL